MKSPYYAYQSRPSMAGLSFKFDAPSKFHDVCVRVGASEVFPEGYECHEPVRIGSPKPRFYDMSSDIIVSERLAATLDREAGNKIRLIPLHYTPDAESKFPATDKYFFLWVPKIECLEYVYGDPLPTSEYFRKTEIKAGRTPPETERPLLDVKLKLDVAAEYPMFRISGATYNKSFMSADIMKVCKREKFYQIHFTSPQERLEHIRSGYNDPKGLDYLFYHLSPFYGVPGPAPAGISREYLISLLPKD